MRSPTCLPLWSPRCPSSCCMLTLAPPPHPSLLHSLEATNTLAHMSSRCRSVKEHRSGALHSLLSPAAEIRPNEFFDWAVHVNNHSNAQSRTKSTSFY